MTANYDELSKEADVVETEVAKGEQNEVLEEHFVPLKQEKIKEKPRSKPTPKTVKPTVPKVPVKRISPRIEELARPMINNVLFTLRDKAWILPLAAVDNLQKIIEAETCLSPEEAARAVRRKKRKTKKATRFSQLTKKLRKTGEIAKLEQASPMLDRNVAVCQYLLAVNFVKSILERQCQTRRKDLREITRVILKRLMSVDEYTDARNGNDDRATQQLHLLAEIIACWIAEILVEVAEADKEALEEYYKKKEMKKTEVDDEETDSEAEYWEQMEQKYETEEKSEDTVHRRENGEKDEDVRENGEKDEDVRDEKVEPERKPEEDVEKKDEDEEVLEREKEGNETTEAQLEE